MKYIILIFLLAIVSCNDAEAGTVVNKDSIALNVKMTHTFLLEEDWFSIKKEQEDSVMTVIVDENTSGDIREIILWLSYIGSSMSTYTIKQNP